MNPAAISSNEWAPTRVVSGGQTGVDRAALDWAIRHGIEHGGWCPRGRRAADGPLASTYRLVETESAGYRQRTKRNVRDSDGSLIINTGELSSGTLQTVRFAQSMGKPHLIVQADQGELADVAQLIVQWLTAHQFQTLNIAGPGEAKRPEIYRLALALLDCCIAIKPQASR